MADINRWISGIGCTTGFLAFVWNIFTWIRSGPRIIFKVRPNTFYDDGKIKEVFKDEKGNESKILESYCHLEVINRGNIATTLLNIKAEGVMCGGRAFIESCRFEPHYGLKLPYVLTPGNIWSCRLEESLLGLVSGNKHECIFVLHASCRDKPYTKKLRVKTSS